jgi:hypothetical protein
MQFKPTKRLIAKEAKDEETTTQEKTLNKQSDHCHTGRSNLR